MVGKNILKVSYRNSALTHFRSMFPFYIPWKKTRKTNGFIFFRKYKMETLPRNELMYLFHFKSMFLLLQCFPTFYSKCYKILGVLAWSGFTSFISVVYFYIPWKQGATLNNPIRYSNAFIVGVNRVTAG